MRRFLFLGAIQSAGVVFAFFWRIHTAHLPYSEFTASNPVYREALTMTQARIAREVFRVPAVVGRLTGTDHTAAADELGLDMVTSVRMTVGRVHRMLRHAPLEPDYVFGNGETLLVRAPVPGYLAGRRRRSSTWKARSPWSRSPVAAAR